MTATTVDIPYVESAANRYNVPKKQWRKWRTEARRVFNELYSSMVRSQWVYLHPNFGKMSRAHWRTVAWNAAWMAACAAQDAIKAMEAK